MRFGVQLRARALRLETEPGRPADTGGTAQLDWGDAAGRFRVSAIDPDGGLAVTVTGEAGRAVVRSGTLTVDGAQGARGEAPGAGEARTAFLDHLAGHADEPAPCVWDGVAAQPVLEELHALVSA